MTSSSPTNDDDYVVKETATLNWTINDFAHITNNQIQSEIFAPPNSESQFMLYLNPKTNILSSMHVFIYLFYNQYECELPMQYRVSIMGANDEVRYFQEYRWIYKIADTNNRYRYLNYTNFNGYYSCFDHLVNGNLILKCEVDVLEKSQAGLVQTNPTIDNGESNLQSDYQALLDNSKFSDAAFLVKDKEFKVHKAILAARSQVFEAMFSADLEEKKQNRVDITDMEVDVFEHLLQYIYTGKISEMGEYGLELFVAADKYQLEHLKTKCEQYLCSNLTTESVVKVLVIADMHNSSELKSNCIEYIALNSSDIIATDQWKQLKTRPDLLMQLFEKQSTMYK